MGVAEIFCNGRHHIIIIIIIITVYPQPHCYDTSMRAYTGI